MNQQNAKILDENKLGYLYVRFQIQVVSGKEKVPRSWERLGCVCSGGQGRPVSNEAFKLQPEGWVGVVRLHVGSRGGGKVRKSSYRTWHSRRLRRRAGVAEKCLCVQRT